MINAHEAHQNASSMASRARGSKVFKNAMKILEPWIKEASLRGKFEISGEARFFNIHDSSALTEEDIATSADRAAIELFMKEHGYTFFYHSMMDRDGHYNLYFTCKW